MHQVSEKPRKSPASRPAVRKAAKSARWQRRKDARPAEILSAALAVFVERGFAGTKLDQVAERAGVSKGTLYLYFDSKAALFKATIRATVLPNIAQAEAAAQSFPGPSAALLTMILGRMATVLTETDLGAILKLVIGEAGNFPEIARFYYAEIVSRGLKLFGGILQRGIERGEFRPLDVEDTVRLIMAPMLLSAVWRHTFDPTVGTHLDVKKFIGNHLETLLRGIAAAPQGGSGA
jgi:AcrR family transcriptional regulator